MRLPSSIALAQYFRHDDFHKEEVMKRRGDHNRLVYWQAREIGRILAEHDPESNGIDTSMLSHISPIGWDNVLLYGDYIPDRRLVKRP